MIALGFILASSSNAEAIAVHTQVPSVTVSPTLLGQLGSALAELPAVVHRKNKPDGCWALARLMSPTENAVLPDQTATAITIQGLDGKLLGSWHDH